MTQPRLYQHALRRSGGEQIIPLTIESAQKWAEEYLDADEYEKIFGEIAEEESGKRTVTFSLSEGVIELIKRAAADKRMTMSEYVAEAVKAYRDAKRNA